MNDVKNGLRTGFWFCVASVSASDFTSAEALSCCFDSITPVCTDCQLLMAPIQIDSRYQKIFSAFSALSKRKHESFP